MPFQEDRGAEDVPNLLSIRNRGSYTMDGTADFFLSGFNKPGANLGRNHMTGSYRLRWAPMGSDRL